MLFFYTFIALALLFAFTAEAKPFLGSFSDSRWVQQEIPHEDTVVSFYIAMNYPSPDKMREELLAISDPRKKDKYGKHLSLNTFKEKYSPSGEAMGAVKSFFLGMDGGREEITENLSGAMIKVTSRLSAIHKKFSTQLALHEYGTSTQSILKAVTDLSLPAELEEYISFISLNAPVSPSEFTYRRVKSAKKLMDVNATTIGVTGGNKEAIVKFTPTCANGELNNANPPCNKDIKFVIEVQAIGYIKNVSYELNTDPYIFQPDTSKISCYYIDEESHPTIPCNGAQNATSCICYVLISPLPQYTQLVAAVLSSPVSTTTNFTAIGKSAPFALTDVATAAFLSKLYDIPTGLTVNHGSNQSCAEFYGEFYSNSDLSKFFELSGLPNASIPNTNIFGDLPNDQSNPGGEAQLDVEYIMALAPGADTFFYSMSRLNPFSPENEGFLSYLFVVGNQTNPPLVHSLSYGDYEASVFNASNPGSIEYGNRCDQEFLAMGLRGLTVLFSSGDDGIGGSILRTDPDFACSQAWPSWPASSAYVTAVGGSQLTDKYLPVCHAKYDYYPVLPFDNQPNVQCSGTAETVCTSLLGGVITSGGGFSNVSPRQPWQEDAVSKYLTMPEATPPLGYFNYSGRGYPDVTTYASNYFVYLGGAIIRESGTSASAPVFAAMVTLWNDMRLAYDLPPMGFIAPFLYAIHSSHPEAFNDIVTGNNACSAGRVPDVNCCQYSYEAKPGWDASTGLGSPKFDVISNLVINIDSAFPALSSNSMTEDSGSGSNDDNDTAETAKDIAIAGIVIALLSSVGMIWLIFGGKAIAKSFRRQDESLLSSSSRA